MGDTKQPDYKLLVDTAVMAGQLMLASGAEVYRVEDTVERILAVSGLKTRQAYVTSTGFIVTLDDPSMDSMTVVRRIPSRDTNLNRIMLVNDISREFCEGRIDLETAFRRLKHLDASQYTRKQMELANIGVASMFAIMFGGTAANVAMTAIVGVLLVLAMRMEKKLKMNAFFFHYDLFRGDRPGFHFPVQYSRISRQYGRAHCIGDHAHCSGCGIYHRHP